MRKRPFGPFEELGYLSEFLILLILIVNRKICAEKFTRHFHNFSAHIVSENTVLYVAAKTLILVLT
jgi:hypothetical protein